LGWAGRTAGVVGVVGLVAVRMKIQVGVQVIERILGIGVGVIVFLLILPLLIVLEMVVLLLLIVLEMMILLAILEMIVMSQIESNLSFAAKLRLEEIFDGVEDEFLVRHAPQHLFFGSSGGVFFLKDVVQGFCDDGVLVFQYSYTSSPQDVPHSPQASV
jgi:hypothetical protein